MIKRFFRSFFLTIALLCLLFGLIMGVLIHDFPFIEFDNKLKIYEVLNLFITIAIAISIPFFVKKAVDDKRAIKSYLTEEAKDTIERLKDIKDLIRSCNSKGSISRSNKDELIRLFNNLEMQITSLCEQLEISFKTESLSVIKEIKEHYFLYDQFVTNDELMSEKYKKIDDGFYRDHKSQYSKIELELKKSIHKIHRF